jgi:D-alanyl-lipoteichoic acid acyltransferase DltB (MBOAT superfamily)
VLFNSYIFLIAFLPPVLAAFFALPWQKARLVMLVAASYVFYGYADRWLPALMIASTAVTFLAGRLIARAETPRARKAFVALGVAGALSLLVYFKYADFTAKYTLDFVEALTGEGFPSIREFTRGILLPIGISFYTFEGISYVVDVYRRTIPAERNPLRYAFFISFFPHLIAGPIVRYGKLAPQLLRPWRFDADMFRSGLLLFSIGLLKKVLLADGLAHWIAPFLGDPDRVGFVDGWLTMIGFAFQIYFDFSAYSDMALGLARMFGIQLPWNFDRPYRAAGPREFWRRWHVTLSTWLRDYLYIPLGGSRASEKRRDANLLTTMTLGGLWHGAALNFLLWGLYQGVLLVGARRLERFRLPRYAAVPLTFALITIGWVFFRLHSAHDIGVMLAAMGGLRGLGEFPSHIVFYVAISAAVMWGWPEEWSLRLERWGTARVAALAAATAIAVISVDLTTPFIYFKF